MDWKQELAMAMQALLAAVLGGFVGWERQLHGREAGIRTYAAVSLASCVFALLATRITTGNNPHVLAAGVVSGIGFLGTGVILQHRGGVYGLTTAATLWSAAAIGLATGYGMYVLAVVVSLLVLGLLSLHHLPGWERMTRSECDETESIDEPLEPDTGGWKKPKKPQSPTTPPPS